jgi:glucosylceramidase
LEEYKSSFAGRAINLFAIPSYQDILAGMERRSGFWIASTPLKSWVLQSRPITSRKSDVNLRFDGGQYQLWEGFGGGVSEKSWDALALLKAGDRLRALNALFNHEEGCRFHYARLPVGASNTARDGYSCNATPNDLAMKNFSIVRDHECLIPFLRIPLDRIRKFKTVACPWSPPDWMKEETAVGCGRIKWDPVMLEAYALYLARFVQNYRREGIMIDHLLIQNDPADQSGQPGCYWTGAQLRDFIRNYCGPVMRKQKVSARLWLGALDSLDYTDYALTTLSDPMAMQFIAGVACQQGGRDTLQRIRRAFPDIRMMQSDCGAGDGQNTWAQGHATFSVIQQAITAGADVCLYDNMVFLENGKSLDGRGLNSLIKVNEMTRTYVLTPDYFVLRHFSYLVDRYAVRLGLDGEWADRAVVFYNEDDESRVMVIHNPELAFRRVVLEDGDRRLVMSLQPQSINTIVL